MRIHAVLLSAVVLIILGTSAGTADGASAPARRPDYTSKVPAYTFADTLDEQEAQLGTNPLLARFAESRKRNLQDPHHPVYHYVAPENRMNDPNGLCFWQGRWHLFYQGYPPEDPRQHWGHVVSDDLVHWRDLPYAIYPNPEDKCFSGSTLVENDRVIAMYHGIAAGTMAAVSSDPLLLNWKKVTGKAVIPLPKPGDPPLPYNIFDPCIWKQGEFYYALTAGTLPEGPGGQRVRAEFLHRSKDLAAWEYLHPFLEDDGYGLVGDDGACPYFWPIGNRHILLHFSHMSGGKYLLGDYDTQRDKFVVTNGGDFNHGSVKPAGVHAPSACPDGKGGVIVIFNMNPGKPSQGWNQIMSLPRRLTLRGRDQLDVEPAGDIASLRGEHRHVDTTALPANQEVVLKGIAGNAMEIAAEIKAQGAPMVELNVLRSPGAEEVTRIRFFRGRGYRGASVVSIDSSRSSTLPDVQSRPPENAPVTLGREEPLRLRVFVDRSVVEVFVNGKQCAAVRVYPGREDSIGVSLRAQGQDAVLTSLDAWQMKSIYESLPAAAAATNAVVETAVVAATDADNDILIADFEGSNYGDWKAEGEAFGPGPARGSLPKQKEVTGFKGKGLVNTFFKGDGTTGTLTSPPFAVERDHVNFLIGGGGYEGETCIHLLVDGKAVRTATGPNTRPGGSEHLAWHTWDVRDLKGKTAVIQIIDNRTAGWGHISVDHIVQSDAAPKVAVVKPLSRDFTVDSRYLVIPIRNGAEKCELTLTVDGKDVRRYGTELAGSADAVDWYAYFTIESYKGKPATVSVNRGTPEGFALVRQSDEIPGEDSFYTEDLRPQFHFSQKVGWNNDPNGMVYYDGEWHLYFQHNPVGWKWGNMTWGHAVSTDLVHWKQLPNALFPSTMAKGACFSGCAVIDHDNTAGFQAGDEKVLVAALTDTGAGEAIAYSNDRGRTFTWYEKNPVVKHSGRDPKVIWFKPGGHWVMAVFDQQDKLRGIAFYTSPNLKDWTYRSRIDGYFECPEIFELPVDGDPTNTRWVVFAADAKYAFGQFDGKTFTPEHEGKHQVHWGAYYASQTFSNPPDGRRIQIGWGKIAMTGMPFNQMMTFPCELTLRTTADGIRMFAEPVKEIAGLHAKKHTLGRTAVAPDAPASVATAGRLFDIRAVFAVGDAKAFGIQVADTKVIYDAAKADLAGMPLAPVDGKIRMQILVDRPSMEIVGNGGRVVQTRVFQSDGPVESIRVFAEGGPVTLESLEVFELKSAWK